MSGAPLTVPQLAERLQVSADWVYTEVEAGSLPHSRIGRAGRLIRFTEEDVARIEADGHQEPTRPSVITLDAARAARRRRGAA